MLRRGIQRTPSGQEEANIVHIFVKMLVVIAAIASDFHRARSIVACTVFIFPFYTTNPDHTASFEPHCSPPAHRANAGIGGGGGAGSGKG